MRINVLVFLLFLSGSSALCLALTGCPQTSPNDWLPALSEIPTVLEGDWTRFDMDGSWMKTETYEFRGNTYKHYQFVDDLPNYHEMNEWSGRFSLSISGDESAGSITFYTENHHWEAPGAGSIDWSPHEVGTCSYQIDFTESPDQLAICGAENPPFYRQGSEGEGEGEGEDGNKVTIPDPDLEAAIRNQLGLSPSAVITDTALARMTEFVAYGYRIADLTGLEYCIGLTLLNLNSNKISDLMPLQNLTGLKDLWLYSNAIIDLTPLQALTGLESLELGSNAVIDLTPLQNLIGLTLLDLSGNAIIDLTPLQALTGLESLELYLNAIGDLMPLQDMTGLTLLSLSWNEISDLTPLQGLTRLKSLQLSGNAIIDLTPLQNLTILESLGLGSNEISDLTLLQGLTGLEELYLDENCISDLSPILSLSNLQELHIDFNPLSDTAINTQIPALESDGVHVYIETLSDAYCSAEGEASNTVMAVL